MAQFDILSTGFAGGGEPKELTLSIDNPQGMTLEGTPLHSVPEDVEVVAPGQSPTQEFWVYEENYHLTVVLGGSGGNDPAVVSNTAYYDEGDDLKFLDIVIAEMTASGIVTKRARRKVIRTTK